MLSIGAGAWCIRVAGKRRNVVAWAVSSIRDSLLGWLGVSGTCADAPTAERARKAMLELLLFEGMGLAESKHLALLGRVRYARDLEALWYLRPDLVSALAAQHGERVARERVNALAGYFGAQWTGHIAAVGRSNSLYGR